MLQYWSQSNLGFMWAPRLPGYLATWIPGFLDSWGPMSKTCSIRASGLALRLLEGPTEVTREHAQERKAGDKMICLVGCDPKDAGGMCQGP